VIDVVEILIHWYAGRSQYELSVSLGADRKTVRKYVAPAVAAGLAPGGPPMAEADWRRLVCEWFPELADARLRQVSWPVIECHRDYIADQLGAGVTAATIHQRLADEQGLTASVASLRRWVRANLPEEARRAQVTVLRDTPPAGQEAQIDYGKLGMWCDPRSGRRRTVWAFVMVLACSRHMFVRPTLVMDQAEWTAAHVEAFAFFGGVPARLVPDNLRTGVDRPDLYDPKINRSYAELAAHYGALVDPARAFKPKDKARVERPMPYVRDSFWRGREFTSLEAMRADALRWSSDVAGQRACRPLEGAAPAGVFAAVEAPALRPLPVAPFVLATWSAAKVGPDIHAKVGATLYSLPWRYLGDRVDARSTTSMVQFFREGELIKTHPRKERGKQTDLSDYPPEKIAFHMRTPTWCRRRATEIGPACEAVIGELLAESALFRLRAAQGVLGLADKHDPGRLEAACAKATAAGDPSYRTIKGILAAGTETAAPAARPAGDAGAAAHLHGPAQLFADVIPLPTATGPDAADSATTTPEPATATPRTSNEEAS
jgi:transposase